MCCLRGTRGFSQKKFSPFGPAVCPATGNIYTNVLFYYTDRIKGTVVVILTPVPFKLKSNNECGWKFVFRFVKCLILIIFPLFRCKNFASHFCKQKTTNENEQFKNFLISNSYLIRRSFKRNCCESDMPHHQWRVTYNYVYCSFFNREHFPFYKIHLKKIIFKIRIFVLIHTLN